MPKRIQLRRTKGWRMPENARKVDRSTPWGNPYRVGDADPETGLPMTRQDTIELYCAYAKMRWGKDTSWLRPLYGRDLACWCKPGEPCHADVLIEFLERREALLEMMVFEPPDPSRVRITINDDFGQGPPPPFPRSPRTEE